MLASTSVWTRFFTPKIRLNGSRRKRVQLLSKLLKRSMFLAALALATKPAMADLDISTTQNVSTNGVVTDIGNINILSTGIVNFNGPGGVAYLSSDTNVITNANQININAGTVNVVGNVSGVGSINLANNVTLQSGNANQTIANGITVAGNGTSIFDTNGNSLAINSAITGGGSLNKIGAGNLTFNGTNNYSGTTTVTNGQLTLQSGSAINNASDVIIGANGTLNVATSETIGSLAGDAGGQLTLGSTRLLTTGGNNADTIYSGGISGAGGLLKLGTGNMTLSGASANTYSGGLTIGDGTLTASTNQQLGTGALIVNNGGSLQINSGTSQTVSSFANNLGATSVNAGTLTSSSLIQNKGSLTTTGTINSGLTNSNVVDAQGQVNGAVVNNSGGVFTVTGDLSGVTTFGNNGTAQLNINGGDLSVSALTNTSRDAGGITIASTRTLTANSVVNNAGSTLANAGTLTSTSAVANSGTLNNQTAASTINGGVNNMSTTALTSNTGTINGGITGNLGVVNNQTTTSVINGGIQNNAVGATVDNSGTIHGGINGNLGVVNNHTGSSTINGGMSGNAGTVNNAGTISGGITSNVGTINSDTNTSVIQGGISNSKTVNAQNIVSGAITNNGSGIFAVTGNLTGDSTFNNNGTGQLKVRDGDFTGITTLTNASTNAAGVSIDPNRTLGADNIVNNANATIVNSGTVATTNGIANSGTFCQSSRRNNHRWVVQ